MSTKEQLDRRIHAFFGSLDAANNVLKITGVEKDNPFGYTITTTYYIARPPRGAIVTFTSTAKILAKLILELSPIITNYTEIFGKWRNKKDAVKEDAVSRLDRLEKNQDLQSKLNEQLVAEMQIVKPVLEGIHKSIKLIFFLALFACLLSLGVFILVLLK